MRGQNETMQKAEENIKDTTINSYRGEKIIAKWQTQLEVWKIRSKREQGVQPQQKQRLIFKEKR